jgi:hypothetical protein
MVVTWQLMVVKQVALVLIDPSFGIGVEVCE